MKLFLHLYDYLVGHRWLCWGALIFLIAALALSALRLHYTEDILAFLPFDDTQKEQFAIYQEQAQAQTITLIVQGDDVDEMIDAIEMFAENFEEETGGQIGCRTTVNTDLLWQQTDSVSRLLPFLLTEEDYSRIDSLLTKEYMRQQLAADRQKLLMPQSGMLQPLIAVDPLSFFAEYLTPPQQSGSAFDIIDGYIFSADHSRVIAFIDSPYGSNESGNNARLVDAVSSAAAKTMQDTAQRVSIRATGSPVISVGNARRIKLDTIIAVSIAVVLIALLLFFSLQRKCDILYMLLTITFGMLFALGIMGFFMSEISLIVLGISSVIVGIAVNYPLHVIVHRDLRQDMHTTLEEVLSPLIIGNITTVAAFLCLVPLKAKALHDLGLFAALMLIGTILFSVVFLPQIMEYKRQSSTRTHSSISIPFIHIHTLTLRQNNYIALVVLLLTVFFAFFAPRLTFDSDLHNINYMTIEQQADIDYFLEIAGHKTTQTVYVAQQIDEPGLYVERWNKFWQDRAGMMQVFCQEAGKAGFRPDAFYPFLQLTSLSDSDAGYGLSVVRQIEVEQDWLNEEKNRLQQLYPDAQIFDVKTLNQAVLSNLSDNFNYIGFTCSLIVLIFLCINLRSLWLGLIAFSPMLIAWIWILGTMYLCDIHFNIVNIILATFIFGQGDDYTIFITEGLIYEDRTGKPILAAYKRSIVLSALIMFVGIGVLVIARHPAMHSLGVVTILGMAAVVLMAYIIPPALYQLYKRIRRHPGNTDQ